jgi:minor histocompatibility antigen H13
MWIYTAYAVIGCMACVAIHGASYLRVQKLASYKKIHGRSQADHEEEEEKEVGDVISLKEAYRFPLLGSLALCSLYLAYKYLPKEWLNLLIGLYFAGMGVLAVSRSFYHLSSYYFRKRSGHSTKQPSWWLRQWTDRYVFTLTRQDHVLYRVSVNGMFVMSLVGSVICCIAYLYTRHWILNNVLAESFCFLAIQLIMLDSFKTGIILLTGLFFYDIFWVFGTEVMVTVAKSFDVPFKLVFPKNFTALTHCSPQHVMLGLGDVVIPGIFIALCLQFDYDQAVKHIAKKADGKKRPIITPYYTTCFVAYVLGFTMTITAMHIFQVAQPALLYLSPACILSSVGCAMVRGELLSFLKYTTNHEDKKEIKNNGLS